MEQSIKHSQRHLRFLNLPGTQSKGASPALSSPQRDSEGKVIPIFVPLKSFQYVTSNSYALMVWSRVKVLGSPYFNSMEWGGLGILISLYTGVNIIIGLVLEVPSSSLKTWLLPCLKQRKVCDSINGPFRVFYCWFAYPLHYRQ